MNKLAIALIVRLVAFPTPQQPTAPSLRGTVVNRETGRPLANAVVELQTASSTLPLKATTTDDDGRFFFRVPDGTYRVLARRSGFVSTQYAQRGVNGPGQALAVAASQPADIRIAMTATGSIAGRILGRNGAPLPNARVQAFRAVYQDGRRVLTGVQEVLSDDLGDYRLFWLPPGDYFVNVIVPDGPSGANLLMNPDGTDARSGLYEGRAQLRPIATVSVGSGAADNESHVPIFFPGTPDGGLATAITVGSGADVRGMNINALPVVARRVRGVLTNGSTGQGPGAQAQVRLLPVMANPGPQYQATADPNTGAFDFAKVVPGTYAVLGTLGGPNGMRALASVEVRGTDVENIALLATGGLTLAMRISADNPANRPDLARLRMTLRADPFIAGLPSPGIAVSADGTATVTGIMAGDYRLYLTPLLNPRGTPAPAVPAGLQNVYISAARLQGADVLNNGFHLENPAEGPLEIVLGTNPGKISGRVTGGGAGITVVLVPDQGRGFRSDLYRSSYTNATGHFQWDNIAPGAYRLFAWEDAPNDAWMNPDFLKAHEPEGKAIVMTEGASLAVELAAIP